MARLIFIVLAVLLGNFVEAEPLKKWTNATLEQVLQQAQSISGPGDKVDFISAQFLNTRYQANTLIGNATNSERFTVNLQAVDCLTYLEYVEAMRRSDSLAVFLENLKTVRYQNGEVNYLKRKHFFSNWLSGNAGLIEDVTTQVGGKASLKVKKILNFDNSNLLVPGIPPFQKNVYYIPAYKIDSALLERLKNGDYIGIFTERGGLDVNHVGILIKKGSRVYFRHADADAPNRRVVDVDFLRFFKHQRGILVFRPN